MIVFLLTSFIQDAEGKTWVKTEWTFPRTIIIRKVPVDTKSLPPEGIHVPLPSPASVVTISKLDPDAQVAIFRGTYASRGSYLRTFREDGRLGLKPGERPGCFVVEPRLWFAYSASTWIQNKHDKKEYKLKPRMKHTYDFAHTMRVIHIDYIDPAFEVVLLDRFYDPFLWVDGRGQHDLRRGARAYVIQKNDNRKYERPSGSLGSDLDINDKFFTQGNLIIDIAIGPGHEETQRHPIYENKLIKTLDTPYNLDKPCRFIHLYFVSRHFEVWLYEGKNGQGPVHRCRGPIVGGSFDTMSGLHRYSVQSYAFKNIQRVDP